MIALNYNYLIDPLKVIKSEYITFEFTEPMKAVTMRPEPAEDYFHIIMPMNITN
jgi:DNA polymerase-3 subunit beta